MKGFSARERRIISAVYRDAARICWEREWESRHDRYTRKMKPGEMAKHLAELLPCRAIQILKWGCDLPRTSKGYHK